ncbi:MAG: ABC transporter ATP-binding protein [Clostridia bacterium]|nr:ABC transporter ATP-binding protein [Clostridia bacterium]
MRQCLKGYGRETVLAPLFKMLEAVFDLLVPAVIARLVNEGIGDTGRILRLGGVLAAMALVGLTCAITAQYFAARAAVGSAGRLRERLFAHIQRLGWGEMDTMGTATLITRMTSDVNQVQNGVNMFLRLFLRSPFVVGGALVCAFLIDARISLIFVAAIAGMALIVVGIMRITSPRYRNIQERLDRVTQLARENLTGVRVIRAFGMEERELERFREVNGHLKNRQLSVGRISALMNPLTLVVVNLGIVALLRVGGTSVDAGGLRAGDVIALVNYMSQILVELVKLANLVVTLSRALASLQRVSQVLDTEPAMVFPSETPAPAAQAPAVAFSGVGLAYPGAPLESLSGIDFEALPGQTVGVIGSTGSGKSTLVHLIGRFYDATQGEVRLFGQPVRAYPREELRRTVSIVPQRAQLFSGTVRSNLLWGQEDASDEELWQALRDAQAESFVAGQAQGLDARVEQGGRNFSGGQRQRLTIARALVRRPRILILDDSSSALDYATDAALRKSLRALPWHPTVFLVSQRTTSLRHADCILVLEDGRLAGKGTHDELMASCPIYREIHESQFQKGDARA